MNSKDYLQQVQKIDLMINNKLIEVEQWKAIATGTTAHSDGERVQASGSQQKMSDAINRYIDIENEINAAVDRLVDLKKDVISTIEMLNPTEYDLLHKVYIQYKTLYDVADEKGRSYTWATTIHGRALSHVQKILNERSLMRYEKENVTSQ